jgi:molybdopterin molybdotransferase
MIALEEAQRRIDTEVAGLVSVRLSLDQAAGCALSEEIRAPIDVPQFPSSAMDGIAVSGSELSGPGPWRLRIQETVAAGEYSDQPLLPGHAVRIMTGAPLVPGADTVIPVENVKFESEFVVIRECPDRENFVRPLGDDIQKGRRLLRHGDVLGPVELGVLASLGLTEVQAIPRPRLAVFSTGSEIVEPPAPLKPGQIYDSNGPVLRNLLRRDGHTSLGGGKIIADDPDAICAAVQKALSAYDLVITTGGVSMGDFDFVPAGIQRLGGRVIFHKVAVKPGKPVFVASVGAGWLVALPGNPVSVVAGYHLFARRVIGRLMGTAYSPRISSAVLEHAVSVQGERLCLVGARLQEVNGRVTAAPSLRQKSGRLSSILGINGFVFLEGGTRTVAQGTQARAEWL